MVEIIRIVMYRLSDCKNALLPWLSNAFLQNDKMPVGGEAWKGGDYLHASRFGAIQLRRVKPQNAVISLVSSLCRTPSSTRK